MTPHTRCTHPSTPAARAKCRKQREAGVRVDLPPLPLKVEASVHHLDSSVAHMTEYQARALARNLLDGHGLASWTFTFDNARRRAGLCNYTRRIISLSRPLMAQRTYDETYETLTHEVAHALTPGHKHGHIWAAQHRALGGNGQRCFAHFDETAPWVGTCEHGKQFAKYRQPKRMVGWVCRCPQGRSSITWERRA